MRVRSWTAAIGVVGALSGFVAAPVEAQQRGVASVEVVAGYAATPTTCGTTGSWPAVWCGLR
jgi:hypothetical protein